MILRILVESEAGSDVRHVYDEATLQLLSTHSVPSPYPFPYGFVLGTKTDDGSAVDCFVLTAQPLESGVVVEAEPVGLIEQFEDHEIDHKVLAVLPGKTWSLDNDLHNTLRTFMQDLFRPFPMVRLEVGRILGADEARSLIISRRNESP